MFFILCTVILISGKIFSRQEVNIFTFFNFFCFWRGRTLGLMNDNATFLLKTLEVLTLLFFLLKDKTLLNTLREEHYDLALVDLIGRFFYCNLHLVIFCLQKRNYRPTRQMCFLNFRQFFFKL
jgi:hypothetical protein